jgi:hypothetical protein
MKDRIIILNFFILIWILPFSVFAQFNDTKEISRRFKVTPETRIEISNKYGKIELNTWEKDSVVIDIKIKVEEKKLAKLKESMDGIKFDFTDSQHFLIVRTLVGESKSGLEKEILKFKETLLQSGGNIEINYSVWLPKRNSLKIENKFGDVFIGDYEGEVTLDLSNGNLKSHDFRGKTNLTLSFADATINQMKSGRIESNYSELYIKKAESLQIVSKSSTFEIIELKELNADSRRDKFRIRLVDFVDARGSFSNFRISELTNRLTLRTEYGDADVEKTSLNFSNIYIESKSTDINLRFNPESSFGYEITHTKSKINFSREMKNDEEKVLDEKLNKVKLTGFFNKKTESNKKLYINANMGGINITSN